MAKTRRKTSRQATPAHARRQDRPVRRASSPPSAAAKPSKLKKLVRRPKAPAERQVETPGVPEPEVFDLFEHDLRKRGAPPTAVPAQSLGKYVYCIIKSNEPLEFGHIGIGPEASRVVTVHFKDLAAVVSEAPITVLDPTRENVLAHQRVNETVMREHTVIPMSFGTVFKTHDDITELLRSAHHAFADVLAKMQNKVEFGLKVLWDRDQIMRQIENDDEDIRKLKTEISAQTGSTYFARMQYGRLIDAALQARSERYVLEIFEALRDVAVASRSNKPIGDKMIMNAAFLVSRDLETAFDAKVKQIGARHDMLNFKYTGPWPPYNFVNIRLKLERAQ
jgi:hypothetical protein